MQSASVIWVSEITTPDTKVVGQAIYTGVFSGTLLLIYLTKGIAGFAAGMVGYAVQNIGVNDKMSKEMLIAMEIEKSDMLLKITAYMSIFALVLFFGKYIVHEEWMAGKKKKSAKSEKDLVVKV